MIPDADVFADLIRYDSATISNAIETFGVRPRTDGFADSTIRCLYPDLAPIAGRAVTCRFENGPDTKSKPNLLPELFDIIHAMDEPVVVVCGHIGPDPARSCVVGDLMAAMLQRLGAVGLVTDCGARDLDVVRRRAPGFQVFARGTVASHGNGTVVEVGEVVTIGGLTVSTGDIVHGDHNGVVSVPERIAVSVPAAAQRVLDAEDTLQRRVHATRFDYEDLRKVFTH
ncbi:RraA family protein [Tenggerimyces flavus]|uniref:Putative 4-hydroxy-4-methyl-2-oxoglutarate aldolase n=1 Tax=Tenggerimyces flavus TaxID=1708749 RepID=A0ABV7YL43_9ACTN|nr:RraA family protein [Tenggerimyces flavus]